MKLGIRVDEFPSSPSAWEGSWQKRLAMDSCFLNFRAFFSSPKISLEILDSKLVNEERN